MMTLPLVIEAIVAVLLFVTSGYCVVLERRMRSFRSSQESLRTLVQELDTATARAELAVRGLGETTRATEVALDARLREAKNLTRSLALLTSRPPKPGARANTAPRARNGASAAPAAAEAARQP